MIRRSLSRRPKQQREPAASEPPTPEPAPDPDQAWKALSLVNDWIRHAEAKATATLAAAGVSGGVLYNLVHSLVNPSHALDIIATINAVMIVVSGGASIMALVPRLTVRRARATPPDMRTESSASTSTSTSVILEDPVNLLYFRDIARHYKGDAPTYSQILATLTSDPAKLTEYIGYQVHANSDVAHRKYTWANRAAIALSVNLVFLGATAILVAHH